jgi:hypothetical protein
MVIKGKPNKTADFLPDPGLLMIVGNYGSGKTEVAVNLAIELARQGQQVTLADLDIVNPYFRCREAQTLMEQHQIRLVVPPGSQSWADLPIIVPEIQGMLEPDQEGVRLFDVGGDEVGARLLSSFAQRLGNKPYRLWQVINARRPFTDTVEGCVKMMDSIEQASRLKVTGLIANTHLVTETTAEVVAAGIELAQQVAERTDRPLVFATAMEELAEHPSLAGLDVPLFRLTRHMLPPWLRANHIKPENNMPAARPVPIGRPSGVD